MLVNLILTKTDVVGEAIFGSYQYFSQLCIQLVISTQNYVFHFSPKFSLHPKVSHLFAESPRIELFSEESSDFPETLHIGVEIQIPVNITLIKGKNANIRTTHNYPSPNRKL